MNKSQIELLSKEYPMIPLPLSLVLLALLGAVVVAGTAAMVRGTVRAVAKLDAELAASAGAEVAR